jgi:hypothetical protein
MDVGMVGIAGDEDEARDFYRRSSAAPGRAARGSPAQTENSSTAEWLFSHGNSHRMPASLPSYRRFTEASRIADRRRHIRR